MFKGIVYVLGQFVAFILCSLVAAWLLMLVVGGGYGNLNWSYSESIGVAVGIYLAMSVYDGYNSFTNTKGFRRGIDKKRGTWYTD